ncbi:hypothetical protein HDU91_004482, partial [Kappamyces sp. JEL0680]
TVRNFLSLVPAESFEACKSAIVAKYPKPSYLALMSSIQQSPVADASSPYVQKAHLDGRPTHTASHREGLSAKQLQLGMVLSNGILLLSGSMD